MVTSEEMDIIEIPPTESAESSGENNISKPSEGEVIDLADDVDMGLLDENSESTNIELDQMDEDYINNLLGDSAENETDEVVAPSAEEEQSDEVAIVESEVAPAGEVIDSAKKADTNATDADLDTQSAENKESTDVEEVGVGLQENNESSVITTTRAVEEGPTESPEAELPASEKSVGISLRDILNDVIASVVPPKNEANASEAVSVPEGDGDVISSEESSPEAVNDAPKATARVDSPAAIPVLNGGPMNISANSDDVVFVDDDNDEVLPAAAPQIETVRAPVVDEILLLSDEDDSSDVEMEVIEDPQTNQRPQAALGRNEPIITVEKDTQPKFMQVIRAHMQNRPEVAGCAVLREELNTLDTNFNNFANEVDADVNEIRDIGDQQRRNTNRELAQAKRQIKALEATVSTLMQKVNQKLDSNGRVAPPPYRAPLVKVRAFPQQGHITEPYIPFGAPPKTPIRIPNGGGPIRSFSVAPQRVTPRAIPVPSERLATPRVAIRPVAAVAPPPNLPTKLIIDIPLDPNPRASLVNDPFDSLPIRDYPPGLMKLPRDSVEIQLTTEYESFVISKKIHGSIKYNLNNNETQGKTFRIYYYIESMHNSWQYSDTGAALPSQTNKFTLSFDKNQKLYFGDRITFIGYVLEEGKHKYVSERVVFNFRRPPQPSMNHSFTEDEDSDIHVL